MNRVLFVSVENANRGQMAEAFARLHGAGIVEAASAGSRPTRRLNPRAVAGMAERGYDLLAHESRSLTEAGPGPWDYIVTMGAGDGCPWIPSKARFEWNLPDPRPLPDDEFRRVRDTIESRVLALIELIRSEEKAESREQRADRLRPVVKSTEHTAHQNGRTVLAGEHRLLTGTNGHRR